MWQAQCAPEALECMPSWAKVAKNNAQVKRKQAVRVTFCDSFAGNELKQKLYIAFNLVFVFTGATMETFNRLQHQFGANSRVRR